MIEIFIINIYIYSVAVYNKFFDKKEIKIINN
jgi:hypothetical protein